MSENQDTDREWVVRDPSSLGRAIASIRKSQGLDQAELADRAGLHRPYLSQIENGAATEQTERLFRLLRRLKVDVVLRPRNDA